MCFVVDLLQLVSMVLPFLVLLNIGPWCHITLPLLGTGCVMGFRRGIMEFVEGFLDVYGN